MLLQAEQPNRKVVVREKLSSTMHVLDRLSVTRYSYVCFVVGLSKLLTKQVHSTWDTVYPKKYAHGFVVLCFVVVMQSFIMNSHEVFIHIHQGCFAGTGAIVRLPQCQWSKPDGYGKISQWITTTKHSKVKTVCIFLGIYCMPFDKCLGYNILLPHCFSHSICLVSFMISITIMLKVMTKKPA